MFSNASIRVLAPPFPLGAIHSTLNPLSRPFTRLYRPRADHSELDRPESTFVIKRSEKLSLTSSDTRLRRPKVQSKPLCLQVVPRLLNDVVVRKKESHLTPYLSRLSSSVGRTRRKVDVQPRDLPKVSETDRSPSRGPTPLRLAQFLDTNTVLLKNSELSEAASPLRVTSLAFNKRIAKIPSIRTQVKVVLPTKQRPQVTLVTKLPEFALHNEKLKPPRIEIRKGGGE
jgi:hypothetical protein